MNVTESALPPPLSAPAPDQRLGLALLAAACLSWAALMAPLLHPYPLNLDEHVSYWIIDSEVPATTYRRSLDVAATPPLSHWLQQLSIAVFGKSELALRLPSLLAALAALPIVYAIGRELGSATAGGLAAVLLIWHPEALDQVRAGRCYGLVLCLAAALLWASVRWMKKLGSNWRALGWAFTATALLWTHYTAGLLVLVSAGCVLYACRQQWDWPAYFIRWVCAVGLTGLLCQPLFMALMRLQVLAPYLEFLAPNQTIWNIIGPWWWAGWPAGLLLAWLLRGRRASVSADGPRDFYLIAVCALAPLALVAAVSLGGSASLAHPRYRIAVTPAAALLLAFVLVRRARPAAALTGALAAITVAWGLSEASPWQLTRLGSATDEEWRQASLRLAEQASPGAPILVQSGLVEARIAAVHLQNPLFLEYVAARVSKFYVPERHPRVGVPLFWVESTGTSEFFRDWMQRSARESPDGFWVVAATDTDLDRNAFETVQELAQACGLERVEEKTWSSVTLLHYRARSLSGL